VKGGIEAKLRIEIVGATFNINIQRPMEVVDDEGDGVMREVLGRGSGVKGVPAFRCRRDTTGSHGP